MPFGGTKRDEVQLLACQAPFVFPEMLPHAFLERVGDKLSFFLGITSFSSQNFVRLCTKTYIFSMYLKNIQKKQHDFPIISLSLQPIPFSYVLYLGIMGCFYSVSVIKMSNYETSYHDII